VTHFDLAIIGTGSGNTLVTPDFDGKRVAIIESGKFGGTCTNVGCIPTKMYVYAADVANTVTHAARYGIDATLDGVRWPDIRDRIFTRIDRIEASGKRHREHPFAERQNGIAAARRQRSHGRRILCWVGAHLFWTEIRLPLRIKPGAGLT